MTYIEGGEHLVQYAEQSSYERKGSYIVNFLESHRVSCVTVFVC